VSCEAIEYLERGNPYESVIDFGGRKFTGRVRLINPYHLDEEEPLKIGDMVYENVHDGNDEILVPGFVCAIDGERVQVDYSSTIRLQPKERYSFSHYDPEEGHFISHIGRNVAKFMITQEGKTKTFYCWARTSRTTDYGVDRDDKKWYRSHRHVSKKFIPPYSAGRCMIQY